MTRKNAWWAIAIVVVVVVVVVALNGDRLYEVLLRMHGGGGHGTP